MEKNREIRELTDREWLLLRPQNIIGSVQEIKQSGFNLIGDRFIWEDYYVVPGLLKIMEEIIDNSVDAYIKSDGKSSTKIDVTVTDISVKVKDNGYGIPVKKNSNGKFIPLIAWGRPRAGSNFNDKDNQAQMGTNGIGSYATAVFSKEFIGTTCDGSNKLVVTFKDNLEYENVSDPVKCKLRGTMVEFKPDLPRFGLTKITQVYKNAFKQRLYHLAFSYPGITFKFNGEVLKVDPKTYFSKFGDGVTLFQGENYSVAFMPNDADDFRFFAVTNGLSNKKGGTQIDYFLDKTLPLVRDKIAKRYKDIKNGDIKNKMTMVVIMKGFKEPKFDSQSKEMFTSSNAKITEHIGKIDFTKWGDALYKNKGIVQKAIDIYELKEAYKSKQELDKLKDKKKKIKSDKYYPPIGTKKHLFVCEGACLDGETDILTRNFGKKKMKDLDLGELVLNSDGKFNEVYSIRKSLKEGIKITTKHGSEITMSREHRMWAYDVDKKEVVWVTGADILRNHVNFKMIKSKMNTDTRFLLVTDIQEDEDFNFSITTDDGIIFASEKDKFLVLSGEKIDKKHASKLLKYKDFIILQQK